MIDDALLNGCEKKFVVLNVNDYMKYASSAQKDCFLEMICKAITTGRERDGKTPVNKYIVVNMDEPYIREIISILKSNGHWGQEEGDKTTDGDILYL